MKLTTALLALAATLIGASAHAVAIAPAQSGQVLIAPIYDAWDGFTNTVRVANMNTTHAVKAKLVLRSAVDGRECAGTLLYLSPGDVAELTISPLADDRFHAALTSDDDSLLSGITDQQPTFASQTPYRSQTVSDDLFRPATGLSPDGRPNGDYCSIGHIKVIGAYAVSGLITTPAGPVTVAQGMTKGDLYKIFSTPRAVLNQLNPINPPISDLMPNVPGHELRKITLHGSININLDDAGNRITVPMTALVSSNDDSLLHDGPAYLIGNNSFDVTADAQTLLGEGWGTGGIDNLLDIEAPLDARSMQAFYDNTPTLMTNVAINFPTKYRHLKARNPLDYTLGYTDKEGVYHPSPFHVNGALEYDSTSYDMSGSYIYIGCFMLGCLPPRSYIVDGTNYIWTSFISHLFNADKGWFSFDFVGPNPPVPAIAYMHNITPSGSSVSVMHRQQ